MATIIVHASIDENGKIKNGKAGDQTGKEVCTRNWYSKPWGILIRPKDKKIAKKAVEIALSLANGNKVGYDQMNRNSLYKQLKANNYDVSKITNCETDCSAFVTTCYIAAGIKSLANDVNLATTSTMRNVYATTGQFDILTDKKYLTSDTYLEVGDILVKPGSHTVMVAKKDANPYREPVTSVKYGAKGNSVKWVQYMLNRCGYIIGVDGDFGNETLDAVKLFQANHKLKVDGIVGKKTRDILKAEVMR